MQSYEEFHDGEFEGLKIDGRSVEVFIRTESGERHVARLTDVAALTAEGFRAGNVILDVQVRSGNEITPEDVRRTYDLEAGEPSEAQVKRVLASVKESGSQLFEIIPSYGGECSAMARVVSIEPAPKPAL